MKIENITLIMIKALSLIKIHGRKLWQKKQKAFTLIEMLIVLAIISILILLLCQI